MLGSRHIFISVFRFVLVTLLALILLGGSTFLIASTIGYFRDESWNRPLPFMSGLNCGLLAWLCFACRHLRHERQCVPISPNDQFLSKAKAILQEMGYAISSQLPDSLHVRPNFHAFLFGGSIDVAVDGQIAILTGPKVSLDIFRRRYRLEHHVQRVQKVLHDQRKFTENVVKRVELRLRLEPAQFEAVRNNVVALLQKDGTVICELNILVQSDQGIRESTLEFQIGEWLREHNIACEIHRDLVQFTEVVHDEQEAESVVAQ